MQYLANNFGAGVRVENSSGTTIADENTIGSLAGNYGAGVLLLNAVNSIVYPGDVSYNGGPGIAVVGAGAVHNRITPLHVGFNAGLPIDLGDDGFTPNGAHSGPGPNNWIRYPQITSFAGHVVTGTACAACTVYVYQTIANPIVSAGGDWKYLLQTVANGAGLWSATLPVTLTASNVQMVAADDSGNSSEMSGAPRPLYLPLIRR